MFHWHVALSKCGSKSDHDQNSMLCDTSAHKSRVKGCT